MTVVQISASDLTNLQTAKAAVDAAQAAVVAAIGTLQQSVATARAALQTAERAVVAAAIASGALPSSVVADSVRFSDDHKFLIGG